jgi:hypothetical protein
VAQGAIRHRCRQVCTAGLVLLCQQSLAEGAVEKHVNPDTGLFSWKSRGDALELEFIQVLPDYVRAVYSSRGLPQEIIDKVSGYCVFGTILHNRSDGPVAYRVADWRYITPDGERHRIRTKTEWVHEWRDMGVAFRWSMLPDDQTFEVGDWGQGFTTIGLAPGSRFDLEYSWRVNDSRFTRTIKGVECAPEEAPLH